VVFLELEVQFLVVLADDLSPLLYCPDLVGVVGLLGETTICDAMVLLL
jgi:hypothetical protein